MSQQVTINVGSLTSLNRLVRTIGPQLQELKTEIKTNKFPEIIWDFRNVESKKISMAAITAFLSTANSISNYFGKPSELLLRWDPYVLRFLHDISFFKIAQNLNIFYWDEGMVGGLSDIDINPNTKIISFDIPIPDIKYQDVEELNIWKERNREYIRDVVIDDFGAIFSKNIFYDKWNEHLKNDLSRIAAELVVNSLLHGRDVAFVGMQRSTVGATVCVCDSGIGFLESLKKSQDWAIDVGLKTHIDALLNASLMKVNDIGLKRAIDDVIESNGWVIMSSNDCELRWSSELWSRGKSLFDFNNYQNILQTSKNIIGEPLEQYVSKIELLKGYYKNLNVPLRGSRITFEIPYKINH